MWVESNHSGWVRTGGGGPWKERANAFLSLLAGLSIVLSLLIRKLMQLSVLILGSSFYSFFSPSFTRVFYSAQR